MMERQGLAGLHSAVSSDSSTGIWLMEMSPLLRPWALPFGHLDIPSRQGPWVNHPLCAHQHTHEHYPQGCGHKPWLSDCHCITHHLLGNTLPVLGITTPASEWKVNLVVFQAWPSISTPRMSLITQAPSSSPSLVAAQL